MQLDIRNGAQEGLLRLHEDSDDNKICTNVKVEFSALAVSNVLPHYDIKYHPIVRIVMAMSAKMTDAAQHLYGVINRKILHKKYQVYWDSHCQPRGTLKNQYLGKHGQGRGVSEIVR